jgi:hypothetical protein
MEQTRQEPVPVQEARQWLNQHLHRTIQIDKIEDEDLDRAQIQLQRVSVGHQRIHDPDDYVQDQALILHGTGQIENELQNVSNLSDRNHVQNTKTNRGKQNMGDMDMEYDEGGSGISHLPQQAYEIPLTANMMVEPKGDQLLITTERAVYRLKLQ